MAAHGRQNEKAQAEPKNDETLALNGESLLPGNQHTTSQGIKPDQFRPSWTQYLDHFQPAMVFGHFKNIAASPHDTIDYEQGKRAQPFSAWKK
jgi:hypothetical protein